MKIGKALVGLAATGIALSPIAASAGTSASASVPSFSGAAKYASTSVSKSNMGKKKIWVPILAAGAVIGGIWAWVDDGNNNCASVGVDGC